MTRVVVIGAGVGGLAASVRLARAGCEVTLVEATSSVGGLARAVDVDGQRADGGPYILLDRFGLEWAFERLELSIDDLELTRIEHVYRVEAAGVPDVHIRSDLEATASAIDHDFPGAGRRYRRFIDDTARLHRALAPLLVREHSRLALLSAGAVRHAATLLRPLGSLLRRSGLPEPVALALGIWTAVAGQELERAPSPLAVVPAMIHTAGCYLPRGGVASVVDALAAAAERSGVRVLTGRRVEHVEVEGGRAAGVRLADQLLPADAVVSGAAGASTLLELTAPAPRLAARVRALPLQSPGLALFGVSDRAPRTGPYLSFRRTPEHADLPCRLAINPAAVHPPAAAAPVRVLAPLRPDAAERLDHVAMSALLDELGADPWLSGRLPGFRERRRMSPADYGRACTLYRDSMNPVMTARFMRQGRMPRRAPGVPGLYLVGSSTHPGQWVSFCAISGVLGADAVLADLASRRA